jgi:hypothetical protein
MKFHKNPFFFCFSFSVFCFALHPIRRAVETDSSGMPRGIFRGALAENRTRIFASVMIIADILALVKGFSVFSFGFPKYFLQNKKGRRSSASLSPSAA